MLEEGRNSTHSHHTPMLTSPLVNIFSEMGIGVPAFDQVLDGTFVPPARCDPYEYMFFRLAFKLPAAGNQGLDK